MEILAQFCFVFHLEHYSYQRLGVGESHIKPPVLIFHSNTVQKRYFPIFVMLSNALQNVFFITGALLLISFITTLFFVKESFVRENKKSQSMREVWRSVPQKSLTVTMMVTFFVLMLALYSIEPIVTVYVSQLSQNSIHVALIAGLVFSASGVASIIAAPRLGKLSDKIGPQKVILFALIFAGIIYLPQALVKNPWQLLGLRFLLGLATAGLTPSINTILKRITPCLKREMFVVP